MSAELTREARWASEAAFFDREAFAQAKGVVRTPPRTLRRYAGPRYRKRFSKEFRFSVMGPLEGKAVLDVGCGTGENAVLFAHRGARVHGIDVSPVAIDLCRERAKVNRLEAFSTFRCAPVETAEFEDGAFDIVWCSAFLHHVIDDMAIVLERLARWTKPNGLLVFAEPTILSETFRKVRTLLPLAPRRTHNERPLERGELGLILDHLRSPEVRRFDLLSRIVPRLAADDLGYERSPLPARILADLFAAADQVVLRLPVLRDLAGSVVVYGAPRKR